MIENIAIENIVKSGLILISAIESKIVNKKLKPDTHGIKISFSYIGLNRRANSDALKKEGLPQVSIIDLFKNH